MPVRTHAVPAVRTARRDRGPQPRRLGHRRRGRRRRAAGRVGSSPRRRRRGAARPRRDRRARRRARDVPTRLRVVGARAPAAARRPPSPSRVTTPPGRRGTASPSPPPTPTLRGRLGRARPDQRQRRPRPPSTAPSCRCAPPAATSGSARSSGRASVASASGDVRVGRRRRPAAGAHRLRRRPRWSRLAGDVDDQHRVRGRPHGRRGDRRAVRMQDGVRRRRRWASCRACGSGWTCPACPAGWTPTSTTTARRRTADRPGCRLTMRSVSGDMRIHRARGRRPSCRDAQAAQRRRGAPARPRARSGARSPRVEHLDVVELQPVGHQPQLVGERVGDRGAVDALLAVRRLHAQHAGLPVGLEVDPRRPAGRRAGTAARSSRAPAWRPACRSRAGSGSRRSAPPAAAPRPASRTGSAAPAPGSSADGGPPGRSQAGRSQPVDLDRQQLAGLDQLGDGRAASAAGPAGSSRAGRARWPPPAPGPPCGPARGRRRPARGSASAAPPAAAPAR